MKLGCAMKSKDHRPVRGLAEVSQREIEQVAKELAKKQGRETINQNDLDEAEKQVLGGDTRSSEP